MKAVKIMGLAVALSMVFAVNSFAKELKIGYVNLSKVFDNYQKTKDEDAVLQKESQAFTAERDSRIQKVRDAQSKLAILKDNEKEKVAQGIEKDKQSLIEFDKQKREELSKKRDDRVRAILQEIEKIVSDNAKKEGYDYIFNDRVLIYGDQTTDLTDKVLKQLNDSYKK